jgi:hypothetical protein
MRIVLAGTVLFAALTMPAAAETRYDIKLERAVMDIVASRMGEIRGTISYGRKPETVFLPEALARSRAPTEGLQAGLDPRSGKSLLESERKAAEVIAAF